MSSEREVALKIDWRDFERDDFLKNIKVLISERATPKHFRGNETGTRIIIKDLRNAWTRGTIRELYRAVNSLSSPFDSIDSFKVYFSIDRQEWLSGLLSFEDIRDYALYYADAIIEDGKIKKLIYEFRPWDTMKKLRGRTEILKNTRMVERVYDENTHKWKWDDLDLSGYKIGRIRLKVLIFDRDPKILSLGVVDKKGFREYLDSNGGVRVFRSGIRVYDY